MDNAAGNFAGSRNSLSLAALAGMAVAMPLLDLFGGYPQYFVAKGLMGLEIAVFGCVLVLLSLALAFPVELAAWVSGKRIGQVIHSVGVGIFAALLALAVLRKTPLQLDLLALLLAGGAGALVAFAEAGWAPVRQALSFLIIAPLLALVVFLSTSPSAKLIWKGEAGAAIIQGIERPAPVVILFLDEFPIASLMAEDGSINAERFPNFARLASQSTWFRNATSVAPWTGASLTSALTGRMPVPDKAPTSIDYPETLFTLLGTAYQMQVHEELTRLCPQSLCQAQEASESVSLGGRLVSALLDAAVVYAHATLPPTLRAGLPSLEHSWADFLGQSTPGQDAPGDTLQPPLDEGQPGMPAPPRREGKTTRAQVDLVKAMIASFEPSAQPTLYFTHVVFPHFPWTLAPSGATYELASPLYDQLTAIPGLRKEGDHWGGDAFLVRQGLQRHLLQVGYLDRLVGEMIDRLQATGLWDQAVVVLLADHGVSFIPDRPRRGPTPENLDEIYRVPLFIKTPGQKQGEIRDDNVLLIDVLPTLVDILGVRTDWAFEGRALFGDAPAPEVKRVTEAPGGMMPVSIEGLLRLAARNAAIFNHRMGWPGVAAVGELGSLVGLPRGELPGEWSDNLEWRLDQAQDLQQVRFASGYLPLRLTGEMIFPPGQPMPGEVLILLNGRVAGIGGGFECSGRVCRFSALLAEAFFQEGMNTVEILAPAAAARP